MLEGESPKHRGHAARPLGALAFGGASVAALAALAGCPAEEDPPPALAPTYANVASVLSQSCAFSTSCHGGSATGKAGLNLAKGLATGDVRPTLAASACEYPLMKLVEPGSPDRSWLVVKIAGAHRADGKLSFAPDPAWKPALVPDEAGKLPASECPLTDDGVVSFGYLMPYSVGEAAPLAPEQVDLIRRWIQAGAPGPL